MATSKEVKGVTAHREQPVVIAKVSNPKRQFMTYDEAVADSARLRKANLAADEARRKVLAESEAEVSTESADEKASLSEESAEVVEARLEKLRDKVAKFKKELDHKPESKVVKKKLAEAEEELEKAEAEA